MKTTFKAEYFFFHLKTYFAICLRSAAVKQFFHNLIWVNMWIIKIFKIQCFYPPRILNEHWWIYSCLQIPPRENWFQYVRRVYATAINFPCITTLPSPKHTFIYFIYWYIFFTPTRSDFIIYNFRTFVSTLSHTAKCLLLDIWFWQFYPKSLSKLDRPL